MHDTSIPLGPYHASLKEPEHLKVHLEGEEIVKAELYLGYNHRGIERISETRSYDKVIYLLERICGICSNAHNSAFSKAVEKAAGLEPSEKAKRIRCVTEELERIQSHLLWYATYSHSLGFQETFKETMKYRELPLQMLEKISGSRIHYGISEFGGVKKEITEGTAKQLRKKMKEVSEKARVSHEDLMSNEEYVESLKDVATLSRKRAKETGVVGPLARASGVKRDVRKNDPYDGYPELDWEMKTRKTGDSLARARLRLEEVVESTRIIDQLFEVPNQNYRGKMKVELEEGKISTARVEAPRGENVHYLHAEKLKPKRLRIRPPTYANFHALPEMMVGENVRDLPAAALSIDPCFSCADRACIVNSDTGKEEIKTFHEIVGE